MSDQVCLLWLSQDAQQCLPSPAGSWAGKHQAHRCPASLLGLHAGQRRRAADSPPCTTCTHLQPAAPTSYMSSNPVVSTTGRSAPRSIMLSSPPPRLPLGRTPAAPAAGAGRGAGAGAGLGLDEGTVKRSSMWAVLLLAAAAGPPAGGALPLLPAPKPSRSSSAAAAGAAGAGAGAAGALLEPPLPMPSKSSSAGWAGGAWAADCGLAAG